MEVNWVKIQSLGSSISVARGERAVHTFWTDTSYETGTSRFLAKPRLRELGSGDSFWFSRGISGVTSIPDQLPAWPLSHGRYLSEFLHTMGFTLPWGRRGDRRQRRRQQATVVQG